MPENRTRQKPPELNFNKAPYLVLWELTRACALACKHCRAKAMRRRVADELTQAEISSVLNELEELGHPLIVFTGGDPSQRPDLLELIAEARRRDFSVAITPSATPAMSETLVAKLKAHGVARLAISLDGPDAQTHDSFRGVSGSYQITQNIIEWANRCDLPVQINSTISRFNLEQFSQTASLVANSAAVLWSVFFLVPTGRANNNMQISPDEAESVLKQMAQLASSGNLDIKATAAPHFRRVLIEKMQQSPDRWLAPGLSPHMRLGALRSYQSVNDGKGIMFISHTGEVYPSGFLPLSAGNVRNESVGNIYQNSPLFRQLRDPGLLKGKCGKCRYKTICGGSRARAFAESGDYLNEDTLCLFDERTAAREHESAVGTIG